MESVATASRRSTLARLLQKLMGPAPRELGSFFLWAECQPRSLCVLPDEFVNTRWRAAGDTPRHDTYTFSV